MQYVTVSRGVEEPTHCTAHVRSAVAAAAAVLYGESLCSAPFVWISNGSGKGHYHLNCRFHRTRFDVPIKRTIGAYAFSPCQSVGELLLLTHSFDFSVNGSVFSSSEFYHNIRTLDWVLIMQTSARRKLFDTSTMNSTNGTSESTALFTSEPSGHSPHCISPYRRLRSPYSNCPTFFRFSLMTRSTVHVSR